MLWTCPEGRTPGPLPPGSPGWLFWRKCLLPSPHLGAAWLELCWDLLAFPGSPVFSQLSSGDLLITSQRSAALEIIENGPLPHSQHLIKPGTEITEFDWSKEWSLSHIFGPGSRHGILNYAANHKITVQTKAFWRRTKTHCSFLPQQSIQMGLSATWVGKHTSRKSVGDLRTTNKAYLKYRSAHGFLCPLSSLTPLCLTLTL